MRKSTQTFMNVFFGGALVCFVITVAYVLLVPIESRESVRPILVVVVFAWLGISGLLLLGAAFSDKE